MKTDVSPPVIADEMFEEWERRVLLPIIAHSRSANRCAAWDTRLGFLSTALTAVVGTSVFATLQDDVSTDARVLVGCVTVLAATLSAVRSFAGLPDRKARYEEAARRHAAVRRRLEIARAELAAGNPFEFATEAKQLREALDAAASDSPNAPGRIWTKTRREIAGEFTWWDRAWARVRGLPAPKPLGRHGVPGGPRPPLGGSGGSSPGAST